MTSPDATLERVVSGLRRVAGLEAIVLGGSRARGTATEASDYDIGLYFREPLDIRALQTAAETLVDDPALARVTPVGEWGAWIVGGGWLTIEGRKFDLLYRPIEAVAAVIAACREGRVTMHYQPGHPHGFCSAIWMGEAALCQALHDPHDEMARLKRETDPYPERLAEALHGRFLWEVAFSIENAALAARRGEIHHFAGCAYRALSCVAQVLFARNRRYLINEKGALPEAGRLPVTIPELWEETKRVWAEVGEANFDAALARLRGLETELRALPQPLLPLAGFALQSER